MNALDKRNASIAVLSLPTVYEKAPKMFVGNDPKAGEPADSVIPILPQGDLQI